MIDLVQKNVPSGTFVLDNIHSYQHPKEEHLDAVFNVRALFHETRKPTEECIGDWASWRPSGGLLCMVVLAADDYTPVKLDHVDFDGLFARGLKSLLSENGLEIVDEREGVFVPPQATDSDEAAQYGFIARKK